MDQFQDIFEYLRDFRAIVCKTCCYAVPPMQVNTHLRKQHRIPVNQRTNIIEAIRTIEGELAQSPEEVQYPRTARTPVGMLPVYRDGLICTADDQGSRCGFVTRSIRYMQTHCTQVHGWKNRQKCGGNVEQRSQYRHERIWTTGQAYQRLFAQGNWIRCFPVTSAESTREHDAIIEQGMAMLAQLEVQAEERKQHQRITDNNSRYDPRGWLNYTGWATHLEGFEPEYLKKTIRPAEEDAKEGDEDYGLLQACWATRRIVRKAMQTSRPEYVGNDALEYVNRRETGEKDNEKAFYSRLLVDTIQRYTQSWLKILRYMWRTRRRSKKPAYAWTPRQRRGFDTFRQLVIDAPARRTADETEAIDDACLEFWIAMFDHPLKDDKFESGIISGLAVLGLDQERSGWVEAINYTWKLSAIVTIMKALVIYRAYRQRQEEIKIWVRRGMAEHEARTKAPDCFGLVQEMVDRFMTLTARGGRPSPMNRILHMRAYGRWIRNQSSGAAKVGWKGEEIMIDNMKQ
jgi:hypothetical protein